MRSVAFARTTLLAAIAGLAVAGGSATPAAAAAPCQISGGGDMAEYTLTVTFRSKGVSCAQAKVVMRACVKSKKVAGWKVTATDSGRVRFTNKANTKRRFVALPAGASIPCVSEAMGY